MNKKIDVEVVIDGKQYTVSGYENSEYVQQIAAHINEKLKELRGQEGYARLESEMKTVLLAVNLSDDYQKAKKSIASLREENAELEKELFDMKHELIAMQTKLQEVQKECEQKEQAKDAAEKNNIRLETELEQIKKAPVETIMNQDEKEEKASGSHNSNDATVKEEAVKDNVTQTAATQQAASPEQTTAEGSSVSGEEIGKEIAATIGKPASEKKSSRSSRKKRR